MQLSFIVESIGGVNSTTSLKKVLLDSQALSLNSLPVSHL